VVTLRSRATSIPPWLRYSVSITAKFMLPPRLPGLSYTSTTVLTAVSTGPPAPVVPVAGRLQESHGRHDAAGLARGVRLVAVEWVVVLDGAGELPDLPALHVHRHGLALPADEALVDRHGFLPVSHWFSNGTMIPDPATTAGTSYPLGADQERPPGGDSPSTGGWIAKGRDST